MQSLYNLAAGPLVWLAFAICIAGSVWRVASLISTARKKEMSVVAYMSAPFALRSMLHWLNPFGALGWKENPALAAATFLFHVSLLLLLLFAPGHTVMWDYNFGVSLWSLPEGLADVLTLIAAGGCFFFLYRRLMIPAVRYVSTTQDWAALALVTLPIVTAFLAKWQIGDPLFMSLLHVLSGEAMLIAIPFSRLSHALLAPFTRAYMGSEFGGVRHVPDW